MILGDRLDLGPVFQHRPVEPDCAAPAVGTGVGADELVDLLDARRKRLEVNGLGFDVLREGETIFDELRDQWQQRIGSAALETMEEHLTTLVGPLPAGSVSPGWMTRDLGEPTP